MTAPLNDQIGALMVEVTELQIALATARKEAREEHEHCEAQARLIAKLRRRADEAEAELARGGVEAARLVTRLADARHALEPFANKVELVPAEGDAAVKLTHAADDYRRAAKAYRGK